MGNNFEISLNVLEGPKGANKVGIQPSNTNFAQSKVQKPVLEMKPGVKVDTMQFSGVAPAIAQESAKPAPVKIEAKADVFHQLTSEPSTVNRPGEVISPVITQSAAAEPAAEKVTLTAGNKQSKAQKPITIVDSFSESIRQESIPYEKRSDETYDEFFNRQIAEGLPEPYRQMWIDKSDEINEQFIKDWMKEHNCSRKEAIRQMEAKEKASYEAHNKKAEILNRKASNGMTYLEARETIRSLRGKYAGYLKALDYTPKWFGCVITINEDKLYATMSDEDKEKWNKAKAACRELEQDKELMEAYGKDSLYYNYKDDEFRKNYQGDGVV